MDPQEAIRFVRTNHRAVLATTRRNGSPQLSPVLAAVDDEGRVVVSTRQTALKTKNVRRMPRASLCVFSDAFFGQWFQVSGTVNVLDLPDAMEPLVEYYRQISGEHPDWDDYRADMQRAQRCLLQITVDQAGPDRSG